MSVHRLGRGCLLAASLTFASGCAAQKFYEDPHPQRPHAMVLLTTTLQSQPGERIDHALEIDGHRLELASGVLRQKATSLRVVPGHKQWEFTSRFYHSETSSEQERVEKQVSEYDSCKSTDSKGRCTGGYRTTTKTEYQTVHHTKDIDDATCRTTATYVLSPERTYRVAYTFISADNCNVTCLDVTDDTTAGGVPCTVAVTKSASAAPRSQR